MQVLSQAQGHEKVWCAGSVLDLNVGLQRHTSTEVQWPHGAAVITLCQGLGQEATFMGWQEREHQTGHSTREGVQM